MIWRISDLVQAVLAAIIAIVIYTSMSSLIGVDVPAKLTCLTVLEEAPHDILFVWRMRAWTDFLQMVGTFFLTFLFSVEVSKAISYISFADISVDRSHCQRCLLTHTGSAEVDADADQDHWEVAQHGRMGAR